MEKKKKGHFGIMKIWRKEEERSEKGSFGKMKNMDKKNRVRRVVLE